MRIIFANLYCNEFLVRHCARILSNNKIQSAKHQFLLKFLYEKGYDIYNLRIGKGSTAPSFPYNFFTKFKLGREIEYKFVADTNKIPKFKTIESITEIRTDDVVAFFYPYDDHKNALKEIKCYKLLFGNHFIKTSLGFSLKECHVNGFANEIDLSKNDFVNKYLDPGTVDPIVVPYTYQERFKVTKPFKERLRKAMAIGTSSTTKGMNGYELYTQHFGTTDIQPMRRQIIENKELIKDTIDCYCGFLVEKKNTTSKGWWEKLHDRFFIAKEGEQANYTSFDMVETFNNYQICICPEELVGMPGIGFVEGMASGCAYIGLDSDMYKCLGLIPNVHYITYDGTLEGLQDKVKEYLSKPNELEKIAKEGTKYVRENFKQSVVAANFEKQLLKSYKKYITK